MTLTIIIIIMFIAELEVTGHEAPLIVGLSGELTCSTHLDVAKLEWYLVGFEDSLEETANTTLSIDVDVYGIALDGNEFTCRGTTTDGGIHEKTIAIVVKGTILLPESVMAATLAIHCSVTPEQHHMSSLSITVMTHSHCSYHNSCDNDKRCHYSATTAVLIGLDHVLIVENCI